MLDRMSGDKCFFGKIGNKKVPLSITYYAIYEIAKLMQVSISNGPVAKDNLEFNRALI